MIQSIQQLCLRRAIVFPSAEIHGNVSGFYEYGPIGVKIKKKIIDLWKELFVKKYDFMFEMEGSTILPQKVFEASGHLKNFVDPIVQCTKCKKIYRADKLIELTTQEKVEGLSIDELNKIIKEKNIKCPSCGGELSEVKQFNLMFKTNIGPTGYEIGYLRPETAQNIFTSFKRIYNGIKASIPLGIYQIGHSFRNEISPRNFLIRLREFTQAEIELFFDPDEESCDFFEKIKSEKIPFTKDGKTINEMAIGELVEKNIIPKKWMSFFILKELEFLTLLGIPKKYIRFRLLGERETPHYSGGNIDAEVKIEDNWVEVISNAYRTNYDLKKHSDLSNKDLSIEFNGKKILPHVIEPSFGIDRIFLSVLYHSYNSKRERGWEWLKLPIKIAPYISSIYPLLRKNEKMVEKTKEIYRKLSEKFDVFYDEKGGIGKRYARSDEIGIPFGITVDHQTLEDNTVTIRFRDDRHQERMKISEIENFLMKNLNF